MNYDKNDTFVCSEPLQMTMHVLASYTVIGTVRRNEGAKTSIDMAFSP